MPRVLPIALALLMLLAAAARADNTSLKEQAKKDVTAGLAAQAAGRFDDAIALYKKAYDAVPHPEILFDLGQAYRLKGESETALGYYQRYLAVDPKGRVAADARRWSAELEKAIAKAKADAEAASKTASKPGGASSPGGRASTGSTSNGGTSNGGTSTGSTPTGSTSTGSTPTGRTPTGSTPTGGTPTGGTPTGGTPTGGTATGSRSSGGASSPAGTSSTSGGAMSSSGGTTGRATRTADASQLPEGGDDRRDAGAPRSSRRTYAVVAASVGGAALVGGAVLGALARSKRNRAIAICGEDKTCDTAEDTMRANSLLAASRTRGTASTVLFAVGGAGVVTGAILWFTGRSSASRSALAPVVTPSAIGVAWGGRF